MQDKAKSERVEPVHHVDSDSTGSSIEITREEELMQHEDTNEISQ